MCGIAGILSAKGFVDVDELERFTLALKHRGPDGHGTFTDRAVGLGHTRLAILDLSDAGKCPMEYHAPDGRIFYITFNGEIYNFLELKQELIAKGYRFKNETDTEVIPAAFAEWGERCLHRFNGMWSFALWESTTQKLFLARDRFGVKPLYYYENGTQFTFASEIKAFLSLNNFSGTFNESILPRLIERSRYDGVNEQTALNEVKNLKGGHCITLQAGRPPIIKKWWETSDFLITPPQSYAEQVEQFRDLFLDAVRLRLRSDVPVATCLSGGIDSSAVASGMNWIAKNQAQSMQRCADDWQRCFIATFPGTPLDEREYADIVVNHIGGRPHYLEFDPEQALKHIVDYVWCLDEPTGGIVAPTWMLYRLLRQNGVVVSLDGHGGDELLGGYTWYLDWPHNEVNSRLYADFHTELLPSILRNFDRCSMAHGIEVRMPLMDYRLVTYAFSVEASAKLGGGFTKRILRDALKGIMPESVRTRRSKIGFNSPLIEWLNGGLAPLLERVFAHRVWKNSPWFDSAAVGADIIGRCKARAWTQENWDTAYRVATLMNFTIWRMLYIEKCGAELQ